MWYRSDEQGLTALYSIKSEV